MKRSNAARARASREQASIDIYGDTNQAILRLAEPYPKRSNNYIAGKIGELLNEERLTLFTRWKSDHGTSRMEFQRLGRDAIRKRLDAVRETCG